MQTAFLKTRGGGQKKYNKIFVFVQKWIPPFGLLPALREYSGELSLLLPYSPTPRSLIGEWGSEERRPGGGGHPLRS